MNRILAKAKQAAYSIRYDYFDKFIFIHINKTGGSSVENALNIPFEHKTALEKIDEAGQENWNRKFTFTIVRNPWDKVVSHYHYRVKTNQTDLHDKPIGFREWVRCAYGTQDTRYYDNPKMFMPQTHWISDRSGNSLVDKIIKFESIEQGFNEVLEELGMKATLPHFKKFNRGAYSEHYDEETSAIVKKCFESDIETFDYQF